MAKNLNALAGLLAEVKLGEKKLEKVKAKLPMGEARIKQALIAGKRELAKKYALAYEETKLEVTRAEQHLAICKKQYEQGKAKSAAMPSAASLRRTRDMSKAMNSMADSLNMATNDDDMLRKLEEGSAIAEARLDLAVDAAMENHPEIDMPVGPSTSLPASPPISTAEDILKEFE
jgi:superfamily II RNA helicase